MTPSSLLFVTGGWTGHGATGCRRTSSSTTRRSRRLPRSALATATNWRRCQASGRRSSSSTPTRCSRSWRADAADRLRRVGTPLDELVDLLDLEQIELNIFRGRSPDESRQRVFGGQVAGQALVAAGRTVDPDRHVHSLHAYFLRPGDPEVPIVYEVDRIRDGRSFTTRRVVAVQHGKAIFNLSASFQIRESGLDHQGEMPDAPDPETLPTMAERLAGARGPEGEIG